MIGSPLSARNPSYGQSGRRPSLSFPCSTNQQTDSSLFPLPPPNDHADSDASIRYHGERADFSVHNSSRAKFTFEVKMQTHKHTRRKGTRKTSPHQASFPFSPPGHGLLPLPHPRNHSPPEQTPNNQTPCAQGDTFSVMIDPKGHGNWYSCTTVDLTESGLPAVRASIDSNRIEFFGFRRDGGRTEGSQLRDDHHPTHLSERVTNHCAGMAPEGAHWDHGHDGAARRYTRLLPNPSSGTDRANEGKGGGRVTNPTWISIYPTNEHRQPRRPLPARFRRPGDPPRGGQPGRDAQVRCVFVFAPPISVLCV